MTILIFALIVLIVVALLIYGVDQVPQFAPFAGLIKLLIILVGVLVICNRAGLI